jgi:Flp pilus assembly protein TadG
MMRVMANLRRDRRAAAAAELALVLPLLLTLMFGALELGNYFMNEHTLVKAVRNGARFAARQSFTNYTSCSGSPGGSVVADTQNVVMNGYLSGGTIITPNIRAADINVTTHCAATADSQPMTNGIYFGRANGAQIVTVQARVNYLPVVGILGFNTAGLTLNATSEAAVAGI